MATSPPVDEAPAPAAAPAPAPPAADDRREDADWFRALPPVTQDEFRARWRAADDRAVRRESARRRSFVHGGMRSAAVFVLTQAIFGFGGFTGLAVAAAAGALLGVLWTLFDAGPIRCLASAAPVYVGVWFAFSPTTRMVAALFSSVLTVMVLAALAGYVREWRVSDGVE